MAMLYVLETSQCSGVLIRNKLQLYLQMILEGIGRKMEDAVLLYRSCPG